MANDSDDAATLSAEEGWQTVRSTIHGARTAMYTRGSTAILLMWAGIISTAYLAQYAVATFAADFADENPWYPGPLWAIITFPGVIGSMVIGQRAANVVSPDTAMRNAGLRVAGYWMTLVTAAGLLPGAAGLWNESGAERIPYVLLGVIALGYVLFGILHRPLIAVFGVGMAVAFYVPHYLFGDVAPAVSGIAMLVLLAMIAMWVRRTGEW
ncbi:MAG: hypothetical protein F4190_03355 [Acidimicrobiales bacterium]|nr:hypothetical protein [Acidimicrobiales bacterium]MYG87553.1 hypothetical protein [Acidimicrobiales bacterium]MYI29605.1 hypothetical protein [Acidimicrobiales bacterium]